MDRNIHPLLEATVAEATVAEATVDEATVDEATVDEAMVDEATVDEAAVGETPRANKTVLSSATAISCKFCIPLAISATYNKNNLLDKLLLTCLNY